MRKRSSSAKLDCRFDLLPAPQKHDDNKAILLVWLWKDLSKQVSIYASPSVNNLQFMFEEQAPL